MANGDNIDPKKQEELNAGAEEGNKHGAERNDLSKEWVDLLKKATEQQSGANASIQAYLSSQRDITSALQLQIKNVTDLRQKEDLKSTLNLSRQVAVAIQNSIGPYKDIAAIQKDQAKNQKLLAKLQLEHKTLLTGTKEEQESLKKELEQVLAYEEKTKRLAIDAKNILDQKVALEEKIASLKASGNKDAAAAAQEELDKVNQSADALNVDIQQHKDKKSTLKDITTEEAKQSLHIINTIGNLEGANIKLQEQLDKQIAINNAMGLSGVALKGINKLLGGALGDTGQLLKNAEDRIKKLVEERSYYDENGKLIVGNVSKLRGFGIQVQEVGKSIMSNMVDPLVLIKAILDYSKQTTQLQKSLSLTNEQAKELKQNFASVADDMGDAAINSMTIQKAALGINDALGGFAFTFDTPEMEKMVGEAAKFQKKMGATNEEMTAIFQSSLATGKGIEQQQKELLGVTSALEKQTGIRLNEGKLMKEAASVTGEIRAQLGGSVVEIGKAIAVAKSFGMELKDVAATANSLLNFEQSIGAELEAELITGKQINLEKARLAALTGDYKSLAEEINKNVGDFNDFSNMNVLQQRAMAEAFGMTSDQMSDMLLKEGNIEEMKQKARDANDEETLKMLEQRDLQEQFADSMEKIKQIFVDIVGGPGGDLLKMIAGMAEKIAIFAQTGLGGVVIKAMILYKLFAGPIMNAMKTFKTISTFLKGNQLAINAAEKVGLINKKQAIMARGRATALASAEGNTEKLNNVHKNAGLLTMIRKNAARLTGNIRQKIGLGLTKARNIAEKLNLGFLLKQGLAMGKNVIKSGISLGFSIAKAIASAAKGAFSALGSIPFVGPILAIAALAGATALIISKTKPKKKALGGPIMGPSHAEGGVPIEAEGGEFMIKKAAASKIGSENLETINKGNLPVVGAAPPPQDNSDIIAAITALGEKPGMAQTKTDTVPAPTDLFADNTKIGKGEYQKQNEGQVLFT